MSQFLAVHGGRKRGPKIIVKSDRSAVLAIICVLFIGCFGQTDQASADVNGLTAAILPPTENQILLPQVSVAWPRYSSSSLLVRLEPGQSADEVVHSFRAAGLGVKTHLNLPDFVSVTVPAGISLEATQKYLIGLPQVASAKPHLLLHQLYLPNDPYFADTDPETTLNQYYLYDINAPQAWDLQQGSHSTTIAVVDSGITAFHEDLAANVVAGWDFVGTNAGWMGYPGRTDDVYDPVGDSNPTVWDPAWGQPGDKSPPFPTIDNDPEYLPVSDPDYTANWWADHYDPAIGDIIDNDYSLMGLDWDGGVSHGSLVAGVIGTVTDNATGFAGMAFNCGLMPLRVINAEGWGWGIDAHDAIIYAADHGADVINCSFGFGPMYTIDPSEFEAPDGEAYLVQAAIEYAVDKGCIIICSSGNSDENPSYPDYDNHDGHHGGLDFPACLPETISVGAVDWNGERAYYSSYADPDLGEVLDIVAPGHMAWSTGVINASLWYQSEYLYSDEYGDPIQYPLGEDTYEVTPGGTSFTAPVVSGFAGLLKTRYSGMTYLQFRDFIQESAFDLGDPLYDDYYGYGRLDAYGAILYADANIPEPTTIALFGLGLLGLAARLRRRS